MTNKHWFEKSGAELLAKLEQWQAQQGGHPTIFGILSTGDSELFGAYVLRQSRSATRAAIENIWVEVGYDFSADRSTARLIGAFAAPGRALELVV